MKNFLVHFNPYHDPANGQFTTGGLGDGSSSDGNQAPSSSSKNKSSVVILKPKTRFTRRDIRNMSYQDLNRLVQRKQKEKEYYELKRNVSSLSNPINNAIKRALLDAGKDAIQGVSKELFVWLGQKAIAEVISKAGKKYNREDVTKAVFGKLNKSIEEARKQREYREKNEKQGKDGKNNK